MNNPAELTKSGENGNLLRDLGIGAGIGAVVVGSLAVWAKVDPESVHTVTAHVLNFLGFHPLFEGPQDGGSVM